jgi:hypothetical protein
MREEGGRAEHCGEERERGEREKERVYRDGGFG